MWTINVLNVLCGALYEPCLFHLDENGSQSLWSVWLIPKQDLTLLVIERLLPGPWLHKGFGAFGFSRSFCYECLISQLGGNQSYRKRRSSIGPKHIPHIDSSLLPGR